ncbi:ArsR/SmtB family transcription factor [Pseudomonas mucidolens]|uniref:ArsR/SmtB family transcription factor n=1 Tax=Pseudomonas mucidolens TaxID=46679 RepID=UPI0030DC8EB6
MAMASEQRLTILKLLAAPQKHFGHQQSADPLEFGVCMSLIAEALAIAQPSASRHLAIIREAGFIKVRKHLKWSYCKRDEGAISEYLNWLARELASGA